MTIQEDARRSFRTLRSEDSRFRSWTRFSFGPPYANVEMGLDRLAQMLRG